jgi:hypothetical protein
MVNKEFDGSGKFTKLEGDRLVKNRRFLEVARLY